MFEKVICFTDIHHGYKGNSKVFNEDCVDFISWMCSVAKEKNIKTCMCLGDWHDNRNAINVSTLNYTLQNLRKLSDSFDDVYIIIGNHDLFYREKREIHSLPMGSEFQNIHMINDITTMGDVTLVPWMVGEEWKKIENLTSKYIFGHFEIPGFKLNAQIEMPDQGEINKGHFKNTEYAFSGHFHKRQRDGNVHYIGNPFGHNFSDVWDFDRGCMVLEHGGKPEFINWADGPKYISGKLSELINDPEKYLLPKSYIKCETDLDMTYMEANQIREAFIQEYKVREFKLIPKKSDVSQDSDIELNNFETVDEMVLRELQNLQDGKYKQAILTAIYTGLE